MIRIGILGTDNSHALHFARLCNVPDPVTGEYAYPGIRVTHVYGHDAAETGKVLEEGKADCAVGDPLEMMGKVDAVMTVFRHGGLHARYALPFIRAGVPSWVDKPFAVSVGDARLMVEEAAKKGTPLTGGSSCKWLYDVLLLKNAVETQSVGRVVSGMINFTVQMDSRYAGIHFYAPHLVEMVQQVFGYDICSVRAAGKNGSLIAVARYDRYDVVLNFNGAAGQYHGIVIGEKKNLVREIDLSNIYRLGMDPFVRMLETGRPPFDPGRLVLTAAVVCAIERSLAEDREMPISDLL